MEKHIAWTTTNHNEKEGMVQSKRGTDINKRNVYIEWIKKNMSKFQLRYLKNYALLLADISHLLHHVVFIHCKLYNCSFANFPTAAKTAMPHSLDAMTPGKDTG
jgi:hypothetical protein